MVFCLCRWLGGSRLTDFVSRRAPTTTCARPRPVADTVPLHEVSLRFHHLTPSSNPQCGWTGSLTVSFSNRINYSGQHLKVGFTS